MNRPQDDDQDGAVERTRDAARQAAEEVRNRARATAEAVRDDAAERADNLRQALADDIAALGRAMRSGEGELRNGSPQARAWDGIAGGLDATAEALRHHSSADMARSIGAFARANPATFLGGAAALGFALCRIGKVGLHEATRPDGQASPDEGLS